MEPMEALWTTDEVAAFLKVDVVTVRRLVTRGELSAYRVGGEYRFMRSDLLEYLSRQQVRVPAGGHGLAQTPLAADTPAMLRAAQLLQVTPLLSRRARRSLEYAQEEARAGTRGYLGTEHILLGLIREESGMAARALEELGITIAAVRTALAAGEDWPERQPQPAGDELLVTSSAQRTLHAALRQGVAWQHEYVGTEHLLYGLACESEANVTLLLEQLGVASDMVQAEVLRLVRARAGGEAM